MLTLKRSTAEGPGKQSPVRILETLIRQISWLFEQKLPLISNAVNQTQEGYRGRRKQESKMWWFSPLALGFPPLTILLWPRMISLRCSEECLKTPFLHPTSAFATLALFKHASIVIHPVVKSWRQWVFITRSTSLIMCIVMQQTSNFQFISILSLNVEKNSFLVSVYSLIILFSV